MSDREIKEISTTDADLRTFKSGLNLKTYYDANHIKHYKLKDLSKKYVNEQNIKNIMLKYATKEFKTNFLKYCYDNMISNNISETIEYHCYYMNKNNKELIIYYMNSTAYIINGIQLV